MLCVACKTPIPDGAKVCSGCKSYQQPWRNWISYFGANAAVLTLVIAGATYVVQTLSVRISEWTARDEIRIAFLSSRGLNGVINSGDHEVILMSEDFTCKPFGFRVGGGINQKASPRDLITYGEDSESGWGIDSRSMAKKEPASSRELMFLDNASAAPYKSRFPDLRTFPGSATITFFSIHDRQQKQQTFDCECFIINDPKTSSQPPEVIHLIPNSPGKLNHDQTLRKPASKKRNASE